jgi:hypothetical protein
MKINLYEEREVQDKDWKEEVGQYLQGEDSLKNDLNIFLFFKNIFESYFIFIEIKINI